MLDDIKKMQGINNNEFDNIIQNYIGSAKKDLEMIGIDKSKIVENDKLIYSAIISYVKSNIDVDNSELFANAYSLQKDALRHMDYYTNGVHWDNIFSK